MSHSKERHEKICLNCNAALYGRYCHVCGQENIEPKETVWGLISHFFYDITHFDGKFISTTKLLLIRPGLLPKEYIEGRRARYLHPIKMYVFSSALFFLCLYSLFHVKDTSEGGEDKDKKTNIIAALPDSVRARALVNAKDAHDSAAVLEALDLAGPYIRTTEKEKKKDTTNLASGRWKKKKYSFNIVNPNPEYTSIREYDSVQKVLPVSERDGWIERHAKHREIELYIRYHGDQKAMWHDLLEKFVHTFPYLLFISLPLYAFYLKLLYIRRKQFLYVTHGIFMIYLYIFTFINLLVYFGFDQIRESMDWDWIGWIQAAVLLYGVWYAYKAMRKFYAQGTGKTMLKFIILNTCAFWSVIILFMGFFLFAVFKF